MQAILSFLWSICGQSLINIIITVGLPAGLEWLMKKGLPKWLADKLLAIAKAALEQIGAVKANPELSRTEEKAQIRSIKKQARADIKAHCAGVACPPDTK